MSNHTAIFAVAASWLVGAALFAGPALAQTSAPPAAAPSAAAPSAAAPAAAAAPDATTPEPELEIVDLACTITKGGYCRPGEDCKSTDRIGEEPLPFKMTIDFDNRVVMAPVSRGYVSSSRIAMLAQDQDQLMLHGIEHGFAWMIAVQDTTRALSVTVASVRGVFVGYGNCVPIADLQLKKK